MAFLSSETLEARLDKGLVLPKYDEERIECGAYELSLGSEIFITNSSSQAKMLLGPNEQISIPPGQFAILITEESIAMPLDCMAFISIKSGLKLTGLINISGFHVDPGFEGKLKFSVYNAGPKPVALTRGARLFPMWLAELDKKTSKGYEGASQKQDTITDRDVTQLLGTVRSPAALWVEIEKLKNRLRNFLWLATTSITILGGIFLSVIINIYPAASDAASDEININVAPIYQQSDTTYISSQITTIKPISDNSPMSIDSQALGDSTSAQ